MHLPVSEIHQCPKEKHVNFNEENNQVSTTVIWIACSALQNTLATSHQPDYSSKAKILLCQEYPTDDKPAFADVRFLEHDSHYLLIFVIWYINVQNFVLVKILAYKVIIFLVIIISSFIMIYRIIRIITLIEWPCGKNKTSNRPEKKMFRIRSIVHVWNGFPYVLIT